MSNLITDSDYKIWLYSFKENVKKSQIKASISMREFQTKSGGKVEDLFL
jgi:hypothetical protein